MEFRISFRSPHQPILRLGTRAQHGWSLVCSKLQTTNLFEQNISMNLYANSLLTRYPC